MPAGDLSLADLRQHPILWLQANALVVYGLGQPAQVRDNPGFTRPTTQPPARSGRARLVANLETSLIG